MKSMYQAIVSVSFKKESSQIILDSMTSMWVKAKSESKATKKINKAIKKTYEKKAQKIIDSTIYNLQCVE